MRRCEFETLNLEDNCINITIRGDFAYALSTVLHYLVFISSFMGFMKDTRVKEFYSRLARGESGPALRPMFFTVISFKNRLRTAVDILRGNERVEDNMDVAHEIIGVDGKVLKAHYEDDRTDQDDEDDDGFAAGLHAEIDVPEKF
jgi:hypothetical protein